MDAEAYIGSRALPTIFNFSANMLEVIDFQIILFQPLLIFSLQGELPTMAMRWMSLFHRGVQLT